MNRPPVLLLHGQPGSSADWDAVVARIREHAVPIAIDRPGWDGATPASDLEGNARAALAALDARGVTRAVVVGHSLGAAVAAWLAAVHPERVAALVLAAPAANMASLYRMDRWLAAPVAAELTATMAMLGVGLALTAAPVRQRIAAASGIDSDYLRSAGRAALKPGAWLAYASEQRTLVRDLPELELRLGDIAAPTTIVAGGADRIVPPRAARELAAQIPRAHLVVVRNGGHMLPQRAPAVLADAVLTALDG